MSETLRDAALALAAAGLPVFPLLPRTKRPRFKGAYKNATCDLALISEHWQQRRHDNIGVRPPLGMLVVDVDVKSDGPQQLARLVAENSPLPDTWTVRTGSGGFHYWLRVSDCAEMRAQLCRGVDLKHGGNGFVVGAGSIHRSGQRYEWLTPPIGEPAAAPMWLRDAARKPAPQTWLHVPSRSNGGGTYSVQCLSARISASREGWRNRTFYGAVKDAQRQGDLDAFADELAAAARSVGLDEHEIACTLRSVRGAR